MSLHKMAVNTIVLQIIRISRSQNEGDTESVREEIRALLELEDAFAGLKKLGAFNEESFSLAIVQFDLEEAGFRD